MARKYSNVVRLIAETPWACLPSVLLVVRGIVGEHLAGALPDEDELAERFEVQREQSVQARARASDLSGAGVAVLPLYGVLTPRADLMTEMSGGTSMQVFRGWVKSAAEDPSVGAIVIDVDSPGGMVGGVPEAAAEIRAARQRKPVLAVANTLAASAGYWLASQANDVVVAPSAEVGSIGVFAAHQDLSEMEEKLGVHTTLISAGRYKTEGNPFEPLDEEAQAALQSRIDAYYELFSAEVAEGRGTTLAKVQGPQYGEGRMVLAGDAVRQKMADRVGTLEEAVVLAARRAKSASTRKTAAFALETSPNVGRPPTMTVLHTFADMNPNAMDWLGTPVEWGQVLASAGSATADRPARPMSDEKEQTMEELQEPTEAPETAPAEPRAVDPARDDLNKVVHDLKDAVVAMNEGRGDRETIERLQDELMELRKRVDESGEPSGYRPGDDVAAQFPTGISVAGTWEMTARKASVLLAKSEDDVLEFREKADNLLLLSAAMKKNPRDLAYFEKEYLPALAAIDTQTTGEGKEFVPTILSGDLIPRVELALRVVALFRAIEMPSNPYEIPGFGLVRVRGGKAVENVADTGQIPFKKITPGTRKITLAAVKFAAEVLVSKEEEEDSLIPILSFLRDEVTSQLSFDMEDAVINGDAQGAHMDADVTATDDPRKAWDGLRNLAQAGQKTDGSGASIDAAKLRVNRKKLGKYGVDSSQLVHIMSVAGYVNMLADANVLTVDKYGPNATILNGELASIDGIPIVVSQFVRDDLNATGVYDGTTMTRTIAITVNPRGYVIGNRRALTVQTLTELYAEFDQDAIAVSMRKAFAPVYPASEPLVAITYNLLN